MRIQRSHGLMVVVVAVHALVAGTTDADGEEEREMRAVVEANHAFARDMYWTLAGANVGENLFFSPYSISSALAMTLEGARGETLEEMYTVLHVPVEGDDRWLSARLHVAMGRLVGGFNKDGKPYELVVANALWGERTMPFREEFLGAIQPHYDAKLEMMDFIGNPQAERQRINQWVEEKTMERIVDLLPEDSITVDTRLVLTNAIYFKAAWASPFQEGATMDRDFHLVDGTSVQVATMYERDVRIGRHQADGFEVIEIPYDGHSVAMVILLPDEPGGLAAVEQAISPEAWLGWVDGLEFGDAHLYLPKFRVETEYELNDPLKAMGMPLAFDARQADFTNITDSPEGEKLFISTVAHKAFIEVDESGTEAAAATAVVISIESAALEEPPEVRINRPFVFAIRDRDTGSLLFMGRVVDPR